MTKQQIFPIILMTLDIAAGAVYAGHGDWKKTIYWIGAAVLTATVTFYPKETPMTDLPDNVKIAFQTLLAPYGICFADLLDSAGKSALPFGKRYFSLAEVKSITGLHTSRIWQLATRGAFVTYKTGPGRNSTRLYDAASLDVWIQSLAK